MATPLALTVPDRGYLRRDVAVARDDGAITIQHAFWKLALPAAWVDAQAELTALLERRVRREAVAPRDHQVAAVLQLLDYQRCFTFPDDRETYTLPQVKELFRDVATQWYASYNSHPLWQRLRDGTLSRNALLAWVMHTYHLSRSAGITAARSASRLAQPQLRALFAESAVEEYSHFREYFGVAHGRLPISATAARRYVPLPASLAFDQQMMRIAEDDWLAHVLVGFFQESTSAFHERCLAFYRTVETNYGLAGLLDGWEAHLRLDIDYGHAGAFGVPLDEEASVSQPHLVASLRNAWFTFCFLRDALDEILAEERSGGDIVLREPVRHGLLDTPVAPPELRDTSPLQVRRASALARELQERGLDQWSTAAPAAIPDADDTFLLVESTAAIFSALSHAHDDEEILLFGQLAERSQTAEVPAAMGDNLTLLQPRSQHALALANFLRHVAERPQKLAFLLLLLAEDDDAHRWLPVDDVGVGLLADFLDRPVTARERDTLATLALQGHEFSDHWRTRAAVTSEPDFFND